jgi:two-component system, NarL family, response regulator
VNQSNIIRVLIADDHSVVAHGLVLLLECELDITVIGQARNGYEALQLFRQHQPDVTLMDLRMPEMDGVAAISAIRAEFNDAGIIVLTTYDGDEDIYRGLRAGAKGYLLKDAEPDELMAAIRTVHSGQKYIPPNIGAKLVERMSNPQLSDRELEIVRLMVAGKTTQEISAALSIAESTVKFHINNILSKLGVNDRTQAVLAAVKRGIVNI